MEWIAVLSIPAIILGVLWYGGYKKVKVYEAFMEGAGDGISTMLRIFPALLGLIVSVSMLRASSVFDLLARLVSPVTDKIGLPASLIPLMLMRPISGSGAMAVITDIFENLSPDSFEGLCASVIMGSTETTFYTIAVYYGAVGITKIRHTAKAALIADLVGMFGSVIAVRLILQ